MIVEVLRLEDLIFTYVGDIVLWDRDEEDFFILDSSWNQCVCWLGVVPVPRISVAFCASNKLAVVLDCDVDALWRFHASIDERMDDFFKEVI